MKKITTPPLLLARIGATDPRNKLGVPIRIWTVFNRTEIIIRIENQDEDAKFDGYKPKNGALGDGEISKYLLKLLKGMNIIKSPKNWGIRTEDTKEIILMDEYEDATKCIYAVFTIKPELLAKF